MRSGLRPALLKPAALPASNPLIRSPILITTVVVVKLYFVSCFCDLVEAFIAWWQCSSTVASWYTFAEGFPGIVKELWCTECRLCLQHQRGKHEV